MHFKDILLLILQEEDIQIFMPGVEQMDNVEPPQDANSQINSMSETAKSETSSKIDSSNTIINEHLKPPQDSVVDTLVEPQLDSTDSSSQKVSEEHQEANDRSADISDGN